MNNALLILLVVLGSVVGQQPVLQFPERPIWVEGQCGSNGIIAFDTDGDQRVDYWQRVDASGRKVELCICLTADEPNETVLLDETRPGQVPHFIIALDGVPYALIEELYQKNCFRLFYPPSQVVTCFPGMTNPAFQRIFGGEKPVAYESSYFDRQKNLPLGGSDMYLSGQAATWTRVLDYRCVFELDALCYIKPTVVFAQELQQMMDVFRRAQGGTKIAYCAATAGLGTRGGKEAILGYLRTIDRLCEQIVYERRGKVRISLLADHGHSSSGQGRISFAKQLKRNGYRLTDCLERTGDVVTVEFGLVTYAAYYTEDPAGVATVLLKDPATTIACYPITKNDKTTSGSGIVVQSADGKAIIQKRQDQFRYKIEYGDPLELLGIIKQLRQKGKVDSDGFIDDRVLFAVTLNHTYPDPLRRIWLAFNGLVQKPADLIVCLKDEYVHGNPLFYKVIGKVASTHGSLNQANSTTFAMTMMGELPLAMRLEEVMPALEKLHGDR